MAFLLFWALSVTILVLFAKGSACFVRHRAGNIHAALWTTTLVCAWLIPLSPLVCHPLLGETWLSSGIPLFSRLISRPDIAVSSGKEPVPESQSESEENHRSRDSTSKNTPNPTALTVQSSIETVANQNSSPIDLGSAKKEKWPAYGVRIWERLRDAALFLLLYAKPLVMGIWILGVLYKLIEWLQSWFYIYRIINTARPLKTPKILADIERLRQLLFIDGAITIRRASADIAPFVIGLWQPVLFLPDLLLAASSRRELRAVIAHELAHLRHYDFIFHHAALILRMIFWFLPQAWQLQRSLYIAQDMTSDEHAAVILGSGTEYAEILTALVERSLLNRSDLSAVGLFEGKNALLERLKNILSKPIHLLTRVPFQYKLFFIFYACVVLLCSGTIGQAALYKTRLLPPPLEQKPDILELPNTLPTPKGPEQPELVANHPIRFTQEIPFAANLTKAQCMEAGDMNGDGFSDLVVGTDVGEAKEIYFNREGKFFEKAGEFSSKRERMTVLSLVDIDRDSDLDLVTGGYFKPGQIYLNDGGGRLTPGKTFGNPNSLTQLMEVGDLNGDGYPDLATIQEKDAGQIFLNDKQGGFRSGAAIQVKSNYDWSPPDQSKPFIIRAVDFDRDGDLDLVVFFGESHLLQVFENDLSGAFPLRKIPVDNPFTRGYRFFPIDKDIPFRGNFLLLGFKENCILYEYQKENRFNILSQFIYSGRPVACDWGDADQNGYPDMLIGNDQMQNYLLLNEGGYRFTQKIPIGQAGKLTAAIRMADMDADGDLDIVTLYKGSPSAVFRNELPVRILAASPAPNESSFPRDSIVSATFTHFMKESSANRFAAFGSMSGKRSGRYQIEGGKTITFTPDRPFFPGEAVSFILTQKQTARSGESLEKPFVWTGYAASAPAPAHFSSCRRFGLPGGKTDFTAVGDMDGDGDLDIVAGTNGEASALFLNDGQGYFPESRRFGNDSEPTTCLVLADMDSDGDLDVLIGNFDGMPNHIYFNDGKGYFPSCFEFPSFHGNTNSISVGDVNADGLLDVAWADGSNSDRPAIYINQGNGRFGDPRYFCGTNEGIDASGFFDVDRDGDLDLLGFYWRSRGYAFLNDGKGFFLNESREVVYSMACVLSIGDFDRDLKPDIVYSDVEKLERNQIRRIIRCAAYRDKGLFQTAADFRSQDLLINNGLPSGIIDNTLTIPLGDLNGDGYLDIAASGSSDRSEITIYTNLGNGSWTEEMVPCPGSPRPSRISLGDMDGDGDLDIVQVRANGDNMIYVNEPETPQVTSDK